MIVSSLALAGYRAHLNGRVSFHEDGPAIVAVRFDGIVLGSASTLVGACELVARVERRPSYVAR